MELVQTSVLSDLQQDSSKSQRKGLQDDCETCCDVWFGNCGPDKKTGGGGGVAKDAKIWVGSHQDGLD